jgi:hypothetical protein
MVVIRYDVSGGLLSSLAMMRDALDGAEEAKVLCERKRELGKDNVAAGK